LVKIPRELITNKQKSAKVGMAVHASPCPSSAATKLACIEIELNLRDSRPEQVRRLVQVDRRSHGQVFARSGQEEERTLATNAADIIVII